MIANTPSGQLLFGSNPRLTKLAKTVARYVTKADVNSMSPTTLSNVFTDLASLSSGMSNIFKAKMALEHGKAYGSRGQITDPSVSSPEAILKAFGFRTMYEAQKTWVGMDMYEKTAAYTEDVNKWYKGLAMKLASEGSTAETDEYIVTVMSMAFAAFGSSEKAMGIIKRNLDRDSQAGVGAIYDSILRSSDFIKLSEVETWSNTVPDDEYGSKSDLKKTIELMREYKEEK